jgi:hypothetical protein
MYRFGCFSTSEEVLFLRDEMANLAWGASRGAAGGPVRGVEVTLLRDGEVKRERIDAAFAEFAANAYRRLGKPACGPAPRQKARRRKTGGSEHIDELRVQQARPECASVAMIFCPATPV